MNKLSVGRGLILAAALCSLVPFVVDMFLLADLHMENDLWLPHAKLHTAMSVHAAIALGLGAAAVLGARWKRPEVVDLAIAAFLATSFWVGLILAGLWPGTAYSTSNVPTDADELALIGGLAIDRNVATALIIVAIGWLGFALAASGLRRTDRTSAASGPAAEAADQDLQVSPH